MRVTKQIEWIKAQFDKYIAQEGSEDAYLRGFHYFIVSLPEDQRKIPSPKGERLYANTLNEYKNLSRLVVNARLLGLIPFDQLNDMKNEDIVKGLENRIEPEISYLSASTGQQFYWGVEDPTETFEIYKEQIYVATTVEFASQTHRLVLIVEKTKARSGLVNLCKEHGVDFIHFGGQSSLTRLNQLTDFAKAEDKPMVIFYISDLDVAGWDMPNSVMKRINQLYPDKDHILIRVGLSRQKAIELNLPVSFDPDDKDYPPTQIERFIRESGGRDCIEVDAVPRDTLVEMTRHVFVPHSKLDEDRERIGAYRTKLDEELETLDLSDWEDEFDDLVEKFTQAKDDVMEHESLFDDLTKASENVDEFQLRFEEHVLDKLKQVEED